MLYFILIKGILSTLYVFGSNDQFVIYFELSVRELFFFFFQTGVGMGCYICVGVGVRVSGVKVCVITKLV